MNLPKLIPLELLEKRRDAALRRRGYRTYDGWLDRDRQVVFGQKSTERNSRGLALFHLEQTTVAKTFPMGADSDDGWDDEYDLFDGDPWSLFE